MHVQKVWTNMAGMSIVPICWMAWPRTRCPHELDTVSPDRIATIAASLDADLSQVSGTSGGGLRVVGRLREDPALPNGIKYILVSHNTRMGAAKGAILVGEYLIKKGYIA